MRALAAHLGAHIDEQAFAHELLMGHEDTREGAVPAEPKPGPLAAAG